MHSELPKVLHPVLYRPMIHYVLDLAQALPHASISLVVGHGEAQVRTACGQYSGLNYFRQDKQLGTGHAVQTAKDFLSKKAGSVLVLSGDVISLRLASVQNLLERHAKANASATILTARVPNPTGYGRILHDATGAFLEIREEADCGSEEEKAIAEVNAGIYCFDGPLLWDWLAKVNSRNNQNEFYLTDVLGLLRQSGKSVHTAVLGDYREMLGINDRMALAEVERELRLRINLEWMKQGVSLEDPQNTWIDSASRIGRDVRIESGARILGSTLGDGVRIESASRVVGSLVGPGCVIKQGSYVEDSEVGANCQVGPYAHLRPKSKLGAKVKVGNFVEVKNSFMDDGSKASHLSYIGDADIGKDVNLGCGFITCNYDGGPVKHRTTIEDGAFIGSDSQMVAPVKIGRGAYVGSGSTITKNVPEDALAISRAPQEIKPGYAARLRRRKTKN
jgi:bifunctional UDP-N-acetylglucosamine pyrophosphorylase / glucosamine-1-phosphate N-acetyltransferase